LELPEGLEEHGRFDVPDGPPHLDEAHVRDPDGGVPPPLLPDATEEASSPPTADGDDDDDASSLASQ